MSRPMLAQHRASLQAAARQYHTTFHLLITECVGSVVEEEGERGIAHIVEHLAFNATEEYSNHEIVKFLEKIGAQFGACQAAAYNASTVSCVVAKCICPGLACNR
eukprot:1157706-Pelagomonas_calceolata.AAC.2